MVSASGAACDEGTVHLLVLSRCSVTHCAGFENSDSLFVTCASRKSLEQECEIGWSSVYRCDRSSTSEKLGVVIRTIALERSDVPISVLAGVRGTSRRPASQNIPFWGLSTTLHLRHGEGDWVGEACSEAWVGKGFLPSCDECFIDTGKHLGVANAHCSKRDIQFGVAGRVAVDLPRVTAPGPPPLCRTGSTRREGVHASLGRSVP